jgi:peptidoglycan-N-acetylglucosamine deacetylase
MKYFVKTPWLLRTLYASYTWKIDTSEKAIYLTFDDGPHPAITPFVLDELKKHDALATFFCVGKNVSAHPDVYKQTLEAGHSVGNHTQNHLNGWKTANDVYLQDVASASRLIDSPLFRPPYGKLKLFQAKHLPAAMRRSAKVVMWDVLSADFDRKVSNEQCLQNVVLRSSPGSIIVFHDSEKAFERMRYALPRVLQHFSNLGFRFLPVT